MTPRPQNKNLTRAGMGRPKGSKNKTSVEIQTFARNMVEDKAYVANLRKRLRAGAAPHMEPLLFYYAYGKPAERIQIINRLEEAIGQLAEKYGLSSDQLVTRLRLLMGGKVA